MIIQKATEADIDKIENLMQETYQNMENKDLFVPDDRAFIERHISKEGFILLAKSTEGMEIKMEIKNQLAAFLIVRFPGEAPDNLGQSLHLSADQLRKVAHMESAVVAPAYRGHHLQQRLLQEAEQILSSMNIIYLMCTIDPNNSHSLNNAKAAGYKIVETVPKYGNRIRTIMCKQVKICSHIKAK